MNIAIQGIEGSFHQIAAFKYFGEREAFTPICCDSFPILFRQLKENKNYYAVMAIENTVAGTILPNYALLRNSNILIMGEVYLRFQHNLLVVNGQDISQLKEVHSHPMAILQCQDFFAQYPHIRLVESVDTAASAKYISDKKLKNIGAIASSLAAEQYGLNMLHEGIETNKRNFTRFLILQHNDVAKAPTRTPNKASICFRLSHKVGSLANILSILAANEINLSKIQSLPVIGSEWEYFFHVDVEFKDYNKYKQTLESIENDTIDLKILGEYRSGIKHRTI